jgi:hypothetical protein
VLELERIPRTQQVAAGALLAEALAGAGEPTKARDAALDALNDAGAMGLLEPALRAAAVLLALPQGARPEDVESIRVRGREALERYVKSAPAEDREAVRRRSDVQAWARVIEGSETG